MVIGPMVCAGATVTSSVPSHTSRRSTGTLEISGLIAPSTIGAFPVQTTVPPVDPLCIARGNAAMSTLVEGSNPETIVTPFQVFANSVTFEQAKLAFRPDGKFSP